MKQKYLYIYSLLVLVSTGCNKFLDKNPDPTKRVPTSLLDIDYLSNSARNSGEVIINQAADEYFIPAFKTTFSEDARYYYKHWNYRDWSPWALTSETTDPNYKAIQVANASIDLLKAIPVTGNNRVEFNMVKGKCHYLRAANYLYLGWVYCQAYDSATAKSELGMPIDEDIYFANVVPRSNLQELYDYVIKEAMLAYELLETQYPLNGAVNKTMVKALLSRIYLSMRNYDSAYKYSNETLIQKPTLMNYDDPNEVKIGTTTPFSNKNVELIELVPLSARGSNCDPILLGNDFFIDTNLIASYHPDDLRLPAHFQKFGNYYKHYYTFFGTTANTTTINNVLMVDEMYLIRAECNARLGNVTAAMKDLNDLLVTRFKTGAYIPYTATSPAEALDIILEERKKSLVLRGLRWIDIKRLNLEGRNISITRKIDDETFVLSARDRRFAVPLHSTLVDEYGYKQNEY